LSLETRSSKGFTLIEVMIALMAMMVAFVAIWGLHLSSLKTDFKSDHTTRSLYWASMKLEQLKSVAATDFSNASLASGNDTPEGYYQRSWTVNNVSTWRKNITVTVSWPEKIQIPGGAKTTVMRPTRLTTTVVKLDLQ